MVYDNSAIKEKLNLRDWLPEKIVCQNKFKKNP